MRCVEGQTGLGRAEGTCETLSCTPRRPPSVLVRLVNSRLHGRGRAWADGHAKGEPSRADLQEQGIAGYRLSIAREHAPLKHARQTCHFPLRSEGIADRSSAFLWRKCKRYKASTSSVCSLSSGMPVGIREQVRALMQFRNVLGMITTCNKHPVSSSPAPASYEALPSRVELADAKLPNNNIPMPFRDKLARSVRASLVRIIGYA
jgi:hypothetical protein